MFQIKKENQDLDHLATKALLGLSINGMELDEDAADEIKSEDIGMLEKKIMFLLTKCQEFTQDLHDANAKNKKNFITGYLK